MNKSDAPQIISLSAADLEKLLGELRGPLAPATVADRERLHPLTGRGRTAIPQRQRPGRGGGASGELNFRRLRPCDREAQNDGNKDNGKQRFSHRILFNIARSSTGWRSSNSRARPTTSQFTPLQQERRRGVQRTTLKLISR
jgi:hypothetical protein